MGRNSGDVTDPRSLALCSAGSGTDHRVDNLPPRIFVEIPCRPGASLEIVLRRPACPGASVDKSASARPKPSARQLRKMHSLETAHCKTEALGMAVALRASAAATAKPATGRVGTPRRDDARTITLHHNGGNNRTTQAAKLSCHRAAGDPWLGRYTSAMTCMQ